MCAFHLYSRQYLQINKVEKLGGDTRNRAIDCGIVVESISSDHGHHLVLAENNIVRDVEQLRNCFSNEAFHVVQ